MSAILQRFVRRFLSLFHNRRIEAEMAEEMRLHLELQAAEFREAGMIADEAEVKAHREFGHIGGIRERCREEQGLLWISQLGQDLRYAWRMSESLMLVLLGVVIGVLAAIGAQRLIASLLFGLTPADPPVLAIVVVLMLAVSAGGWLSSRATRDPG